MSSFLDDKGLNKFFQAIKAKFDLRYLNGPANSLIEQNKKSFLKVWHGTADEFKQVETKESDIAYLVEGESADTEYAPITHAARHAKDGADPITSELIGAMSSAATLLTSNDNLDQVTKSGFYYWGSSTPVNAPINYCSMLVLPGYNTDGKWGKQIAYYAGDYIVLERMKKDDSTWTAWDYMRNEMLLNREYRTDKCLNKKTVFETYGSDGIIHWRLDGDDTKHPLSYFTGGILAGKGFGGGEKLAGISATSADEEYATFCAKVDAVLAEMPTNSFRFMTVYPPQVYGKVSVPLCIVYNDGNYSGVYNIGSPDPDMTQWRMYKYDGIWKPFEWVNPPLTLDVEYRTTERYLGKPVYAKTLKVPKSAITGNVVHYEHSISNFGALVELHCSYVAERIRPIPSSYYGNIEWDSQCIVTATELMFELGASVLSRIQQYNNGIDVMIKYTKTNA